MKVGDKVRLLDKCAGAVRTIEAVEREGGVLLVSWRDGGGKLRRKRVWATDVVLASRTLRVDDPRIAFLQEHTAAVAAHRDRLLELAKVDAETMAKMRSEFADVNRERIDLLVRVEKNRDSLIHAWATAGALGFLSLLLALRVAGVL